MTNEEIASALIRIAGIREKSYDVQKERYTKSCVNAGKEALPDNLPLGELLGFALNGWWNDVLGWAERNKGKGKGTGHDFTKPA